MGGAKIMDGQVQKLDIGRWIEEELSNLSGNETECQLLVLTQKHLHLLHKVTLSRTYISPFNNP